MKFVVCTLLALLAAAAAQSFDPTLPAQILVQTVAAGTTGGGQATTTTTNVAYGYDNATAAVDGGIFYNNQSSTSPSYSTIADPCNASYSNDTGCDTNAVCVSNTTAYPSAYQCVCNSGYNDTTDATTGVVSPSTFTQSGLTCTDNDECANNGSICGVGVDQCTLTPVGGYNCTCVTGYSPSSDLLLCEDEDECSAGTDNCDTNADCANTEGTFTCTCNSGYSGNGTTCTDVDECSNSTLNTCDANATCNNTVGSYDCTCNAGYTGNGTSCTDVDECTLGTDTCDSSANCTNTVGSYTCTCQTGYTGNGTSCVDEDECTLNTDNCDANATCTNTVGSFSCACDSGYSGDGVNCTDIDECATSSPCVTNATCTNSVGSYSCACDSGFIGDGSTVCIVTEALNYCYRAVITLNSTTAVSTQTNTEQVVKDLLDYYVSQDVTFYYAGVTVTEEVAAVNGEIIAEFCFTNMTKSADELTQSMSTYSSNTHGVLYNLLYSVAIADYDECANNYDSNCYDFNTANSETAFYSATCGNTNGTYTCACNSSLYDTYGNGSKCEDPYSYTCNGTYSTLSLVSSWFNGVGGNNWNVTFMAVNASECTGALSTDGTAYVFENCNANGTWQDNTTIYSPVRVYTDTTNLVYVTTSLIDFSYECTQDISQNVTVNFGQENDTANTVNDNTVDLNTIFAPDSTQSVDITISQYKQDFTVGNILTSGSTVTTGELACLKLEVNNAAGVDVQFVKVETRAPGSTSFLDILDQGCTTSAATSYGISVDTSYGNGKMCFTMHRPANSFALEVDLTVNVCVGTCQTITCSTRRRRRRASEGDTRQVGGYETVFKIDPEDQCNRNCGDGGCVLDFAGSPQCVCNNGAVKDDTGYCATLVVDESGNPVNPTSSSDNSTLYIIIGVAVGMLILVTILAGFFCFRRRQNAAYKQENYGYKQ